MLAAEGKLDPNQRAGRHVSELAASVLGSATVWQAMNTTTGIRFSEDCADPTARCGTRGREERVFASKPRASAQWPKKNFPA